MTKLDAINIILTRNGRYAIPSLQTGTNSDAAQAERVLDEIELRIQSEGWAYNTRDAVLLEPGGDGHIALPTGCIVIDSTGQDKGRHVSQNGEHLYDHDNNTDEFSAGIYCRYLLRFEWGCIPLPVRDLIASRAACAFNERWARDASRQPVLDREDTRARARAEQFESRTGNVNILNTADARRFRGRRDEARPVFYSPGGSA